MCIRDSLVPVRSVISQKVLQVLQVRPRTSSAGKGAMVKSYEAMQRQTDDLRNHAQKALAKRVMEHVHRMMDQMGIADQ